MKIIWRYFYSLSIFEHPSFLQYTLSLVFKYKPKIKRKKVQLHQRLYCCVYPVLTVHFY